MCLRGIFSAYVFGAAGVDSEWGAGRTVTDCGGVVPATKAEFETQAVRGPGGCRCAGGAGVLRGGAARGFCLCEFGSP